MKKTLPIFCLSLLRAWLPVARTSAPAKAFRHFSKKATGREHTAILPKVILLLWVCLLPHQSRSQAYETGEKFFPADAVINVKTDYGAKGDGTTDDTEAIQRAIRENAGKIVYLPNGIYVVSNTIEAGDMAGNFRGDFKLFGQSRSSTIIRLKNSAVGFNDKSKPKAVLFTSSYLFVEQPYGGGRK